MITSPRIPRSTLGRVPAGTFDTSVRVLLIGVAAVAFPACDNEPGAPPEPVELVETLRIGSVDGAEPYLFHWIGGIFELPSGEIAVLDNGSAEVRIYSPEGVFQRRFGGHGDGPGELRPPGNMDRGHESLVVIDQTIRATAYDLNGGVRSIASVSGRGSPVLLGEGPAGWVARLSRTPCAGRDLEPGAFCQDSVPVHMIDVGTGELGDLVLHYPGHRIVGMPPGGQGRYRPLFEGEPAIGMDDAGRVYVTGGQEYRISIHAPDGRLLQRIEPRQPRREVTSTDVDSYAAHVRAFYEGRSFVQPGELERMIDDRIASPMPDHVPATARLLVAADGVFWVERPDRSADPGLHEFRLTFGPAAPDVTQPSIWDRFSSDGEITGAVSMPTNFEPHHLLGDAVLGVWTDEIGVEYVVRLDVGE